MVCSIASSKSYQGTNKSMQWQSLRCEVKGIGEQKAKSNESQFRKLKTKIPIFVVSPFNRFPLYFANQAARIYAAAKQLVPMRMARD